MTWANQKDIKKITLHVLEKATAHYTLTKS
nr:hypothetical protein [Priestia endophytica]